MATMTSYDFLGCRRTYRTASPGLEIDANGIASDAKLRAKRAGEKYVFNPPDEEQICICTEFFRLCQPTKTGRRHSYGLKHVIESWARNTGRGVYVSNGACIEAARLLGLVVMAADQGPNCFIGVSTRSIRKLRSIKP
jgi:hypothetical protein